MSRQYKRAISLRIDADGESKDISGLRIRFKVTKSLFSYPNLAEIEIYNANDNTIERLRGKYSKIILDAGYVGAVRTIFVGQIRNVFQREENGVDVITTVFAGDGEKAWQNANFNKTMSENIAIKEVVRQIAATFDKIGTGKLEGLEYPADKLRGQVLSGSSKDILDQLAEDYGFQWSIQDGELITVPNELPFKDTEAILISEGTGMIGSPTITELGVNVTSVLNPLLLPNAAFKIDAKYAGVSIGGTQFRTVKRTNASGLYKAYQVIFEGDTHANPWYVTVEGRIVNAG